METAAQSSALQVKQLARLRRRLTSEDLHQIHAYGGGSSV